jgi:hypothetical protein
MNSKFWVVVVSMAALALVAGCPKLNIPGNLAGQVLNEAGQGQGYITVACVEVESGAEVARMTAEDAGNFFFEKVEAGTYIIKTYSMAGVEMPNDSEPVNIGTGRTISVVVTIQQPE